MRRWLSFLVLTALLLWGCARTGTEAAGQQERVRIGFSMDTLQGERWQRDRDLFVAHARTLGAEVMVQAAGGDDYLQLAQAENMLARGVDVLVVVPHSAAAMGPIVEKAHAAGIKVLAYDRMISYADVDYFVAFDADRVGELQARYLTEHQPTGAYLYLGGQPGDYSAFLLRRGAMEVLDQSRQEGGIRIVLDEMLTDQAANEMGRLVDRALAEAGGRVDAILAVNDRVAGLAIEALQARGKADGVLVAGQDADLAAVRRIQQGTQAMTVYKPIKELAARAAEAAVAMARGEEPPANTQVHNGMREVPTLLLEPVAVDAANLMDTVVRDGFHREADLYNIR